MKHEKIFDAITGISDDKIEEAQNMKWKKTAPVWHKWGVIAAASALIITIGSHGIQNFSNTIRKVIPPDHKQQEADSTASADKYELIFNKAGSQVAYNISIPGHFWEELTLNQLTGIFPALNKEYKITATVNYRGDGTVYNVDANITTPLGSSAYVQVAPGTAVTDYLFDTETRTSDVNGVAVTAGYFEGDSTIYFASYTLDGVGYYIELHGGISEKSELSSLTEQLICGGAADLTVLKDPKIPELLDEELTLKEAREDTDFGAYLPKSLPDGFHFESSKRFLNQQSNYLFASWTKGMGYIDWKVTRFTPEDERRITSVTDTFNYDLSLYPIPLADSVPQKLREIVDDPIFYAKELTLLAVQARTDQLNDSGEEAGERMYFSVLYDDVLVRITVKGTSAETVYQMLMEINS